MAASAPGIVLAGVAVFWLMHLQQRGGHGLMLSGGLAEKCRAAPCLSACPGLR
ncbi:hypothetical protein G7L33_22295 [Klebsiella quasipneumoniae]|nr:hypothetical protein [Klebsiella quasipneumoniae]